MKPIVLHDQYVMLEPDGSIRFDTVTDEKMIAVCQHLADAHPTSIKENAIKAGFRLIKCDIVLTNVVNVNPLI